jgi:hypothetical protein
VFLRELLRHLRGPVIVLLDTPPPMRGSRSRNSVGNTHG